MFLIKSIGECVGRFTFVFDFKSVFSAFSSAEFKDIGFVNFANDFDTFVSIAIGGCGKGDDRRFADESDVVFSNESIVIGFVDLAFKRHSDNNKYYNTDQGEGNSNGARWPFFENDGNEDWDGSKTIED